MIWTPYISYKPGDRLWFNGEWHIILPAFSTNRKRD